MPFLGAHMSIAGGIHLALDRLQQVEGTALQIFTTNHRQWRSTRLTLPAVEAFRARWEETGRIPVAAHDIYLINLAAGEGEILSKSIAAFSEELLRSEILGLPYVIMHPGAHLGEGLETGLMRFVANLDLAIENSRTENVSVLIEITAGQGSSLGSSFEEVAFILQSSHHGGRLGVCYDTCHAFAAGYDIRTEEAYRKTFAHFDEVIGLERLKFFHLNDSKRELLSHVDRHEHIGKGKIGSDAFRFLLNDPRFRNHPMVLETPKEKDLKEDRENLNVLRSLMEA